MSSEARADDREERLQDIVAGYLERLGAGTAVGAVCSQPSVSRGLGIAATPMVCTARRG
jgi:hypothetical protein